MLISVPVCFVLPLCLQVLSPPETYMAVAMAGKKCAQMDPMKTFTMGLFAGAYIAFGGFLGSAVVTNCPSECARMCHSPSQPQG